MRRSAAKHYESVIAVVVPADHPAVLAALKMEKDDPTLRRTLAGKVFEHTASYDAAIATWLAEQRGDLFPERITASFVRANNLRYGENPDQKAAFYVEYEGAGL